MTATELIEAEFNKLQELMGQRSDMKHQHQQKEEQLDNRITAQRGKVAMALSMWGKAAK